MPTIDTIIDMVVAETGAAIPGAVARQKIIEVARGFCLFTGALSKSVSAIVPVESIIPESNYGSPVAFTAPAETEPCGIFGLRVNGVGVSCIERDILTPSGAIPISGKGELYYKFSGSTCIIHPLSQGGDIRFEVFFRPTNTATQINDDLWNEYADTIILGIKAAVFLMAGYKFSNPGMAVSFLSAYDSMKKKARGEIAMRLAGVSC